MPLKRPRLSQQVIVVWIFLAMFAGFAVMVGRGTLLSAPMPLVMFALAAAATALFLKKTQWGTYIYAIGDNPWLKLRPESESAVLDWARLRTYLDTRGLDIDLGTAPRQFAGGLGNLDFLLSIDGRPCVLRRPPFGDIPRGANDMARLPLARRKACCTAPTRASSVRTSSS